MGGPDLLDAEDGKETNIFSTIGVGVVTHLGSGAYQPTPGAPVFENLSGSAQDVQLFGDGCAIVLIRNDCNDLILGRGGNDTILRGEGSDESLSGGSNDLTDGGLGDDTMSFADTGSGLTACLAEEMAS